MRELKNPVPVVLTWCNEYNPLSSLLSGLSIIVQSYILV